MPRPKIRFSFLAKLREDMGLSQVELSHASKCSRRSIQEYENGNVLPSVNTAILIARTLGVWVEDIWGDVEKGKRG
jgi:DNA-binding XRE family transcriptional regulator